MLMCMGGQDGHGENVRESLKPVHRVGQPQRRFVEAISATDDASRLVVGGLLVDDHQDGYFEISNLSN